MVEEFLKTKLWIYLDKVDSEILTQFENIIEDRQWAHKERMNCEFTRARHHHYICCENDKIYFLSPSERSLIHAPIVNLSEFVHKYISEAIQFKDVDIMKVFEEAENA